MFDDGYENTDGRFELSTMSAVRDAALIMYGRFISRMSNVEPDDDSAKLRSQYLTLQETENIVKEHSGVSSARDGVYAIAGDTPEEIKAHINELLASLMDRIMSNVIQEGVKQELIDCEYDTDKDDFTFSVTEKGRQKVEELRAQGTSDD